MASTITIPVDVHLLTLVVSIQRVVTRQVRVGRDMSQERRQRITEESEIESGVSEQDIRTAFQQANRILSPTDICFNLRSVETSRVAAPANQAKVDDSGFFALARDFPANNGVSMIVVNDFHDRDLGGSAVAALQACIVKRLGNPGLGKVAAHEFGHLLGLAHVIADNDRATDNYNLMYPGLRAGDRLETFQVNDARNSRLATRFA